MAAGDSEETFGSRRAALMHGAEPSSGADLVGMAMDFDFYWSESEALDDVVVVATGDPANLLDVTAIASPDATDGQVEQELVRVWMNDLRYGFAEAHRVMRDPEETTLRAVTKIGPDGFYVTATIAVRRA